MDINTIIQLGGKIQVKVGQSWYSTIVERLVDASTFYISPPLSRQMPVELKVGQTYKLNTITKRGLFEFDVCIQKTDLSENIPLCKLLVVTEPQRYQRRSFFRVDIMLDVKIREPQQAENSEEPALEYRAKTLNISECGMLFLARKSYPAGVILDCDIMLNKFGADITLEKVKAEVVRSKYPEINGVLYQIGVDFKEMTKHDKRVLAKFLMMSQRAQKQWVNSVRK